MLMPGLTFPVNTEKCLKLRKFYASFYAVFLPECPLFRFCADAIGILASIWSVVTN
jgi:hypothetical protein